MILSTGGCFLPGEGVLPPGALLPPREGGLPPGGVFLQGGASSRGVLSPSWGVPGGDQTPPPPPPGTATAADGKHPTGMHTCSNLVL